MALKHELEVLPSSAHRLIEWPLFMDTIFLIWVECSFIDFIERDEMR